MAKIDYLDTLSRLYKSSTGGIWSVVEDSSIDTAWVATSLDESGPVALVDYNSGDQNRADAHFIASIHNHAEELFEELQSLRKRVQLLLDENTEEVEKRIALQNELNELKGLK